VLVVIQPDVAQTRNLVADRIRGTILGAIIAVIVVDFVKNPVALIALTLLIMIVLVSTLGGPYNYTSALITATLILISSAITGESSVATYRIGFTIAAGLAVGIFAYLIDPLLRPVDMRQI
jgi:uncharacterized membrane protein YccC